MVPSPRVELGPSGLQPDEVTVTSKTGFDFLLLTSYQNPLELNSIPVLIRQTKCFHFVSPMFYLKYLYFQNTYCRGWN